MKLLFFALLLFAGSVIVLKFGEKFLPKHLTVQRRYAKLKSRLRNHAMIRGEWELIPRWLSEGLSDKEIYRKLGLHNR